MEKQSWAGPASGKLEESEDGLQTQTLLPLQPSAKMHRVQVQVHSPPGA